MATNNGGRPLASVSLDLDNLWSYLKIRGDESWRDRPTYLPNFVPLFLDVLDELEMRITVFIVGADADDERNQPYLKQIVERGHEVGNHSYEHESWLHLYARDEIETELARTEQAIAGATGQRPRGFRGPGFSWSPDLIDVLAERDYLFDASTLPTWIGPLARWYYFRSAQLASGDQEKRSELFGAFSDGFRPLKPFRWALARERTLLEIPVTTIPLVRTPFHLSYLLYLSRVSEGLMMAYLKTGLQLCRLTRTSPSYLLHPLDLLSGEDAPALRFFPGMDVPAARKRELFKRVLSEIGRRFEVVPMTRHAEATLASNRVATRSLAKAQKRRET